MPLAKFVREKIMHLGQDVRCKPDLPVDQRFVYTVLFGLKYLLCKAWGKYSGRQVKVSMESVMVMVMGKPAVSIVFTDFTPEIRYEQGWQTYMQGYEWEEIIAGATERLDKAREMANQ